MATINEKLTESVSDMGGRSAQFIVATLPRLVNLFTVILRKPHVRRRYRSATSTQRTPIIMFRIIYDNGNLCVQCETFSMESAI